MKETAQGAVSRAALDRDLAELHDRLLQMGEQVDRAVGEAMQALRQADRDTALRLIAEDADLNAQRFPRRAIRPGDHRHPAAGRP
jgi:phosphate uptake regulator